MSISVESLLTDTELLVLRLKDRLSAAESLTGQALSLQTGIEARNVYLENLRQLNRAAGNKPRSALILGMQQENCAIDWLQKENVELRQNLSDYQDALEMIMKKYRCQSTLFMNDKNTFHTIRPSSATSTDENLMNNTDLTEKIDEMTTVMKKAVNLDEDEFLKREDYIANLKAENHKLRDTLLITNERFSPDPESTFRYSVYPNGSSSPEPGNGSP